jgi:hypothetical protein
MSTPIKGQPETFGPVQEIHFLITEHATYTDVEGVIQYARTAVQLKGKAAEVAYRACVTARSRGEMSDQIVWSVTRQRATD